MKIKLIDSHAHVQFPAYDKDRPEVIRRTLEAGTGIINIGTQYSTSDEAVRLAEQYPQGVWATVGFHPHHADLSSHHDPWELREKSQEVFDYQKFLELARQPKVVAIGECGLDYYRIKNNESGIKERQREVFRQQIELAKELKKPLVIHCRKAFGDLIQILDSLFLIHDSWPAGVVHFFSGSWDEAKHLVDLGFYLSFGGVITFARDYDEAVKKLPLDRLLVETDAPYVAPVPWRGQRNDPLHIKEVAKKISELKAITFEQAAAITTANARRLFAL